MKNLLRLCLLISCFILTTNLMLVSQFQSNVDCVGNNGTFNQTWSCEFTLNGNVFKVEYDLYNTAPNSCPIVKFKSVTQLSGTTLPINKTDVHNAALKSILLDFDKSLSKNTTCLTIYKPQCWNESNMPTYSSNPCSDACCIIDLNYTHSNNTNKDIIISTTPNRTMTGGGGCSSNIISDPTCTDMCVTDPFVPGIFAMASLNITNHTPNTNTCVDQCYWGLYGNNFVSNYNFLGSINNSDVVFKTNNFERMRILTGNSNDTKIDIGRGHPFTNGNTDYMLSVNGKIVSREIVVLPNSDWFIWPDYVFDNNYKLTPLDDLEIQLKKDKHLQDFPSAIEIQNNGINIAELNRKMVHKIEELTLYIIQLNKENVKLNQRLNKIDSKNKNPK